MSESLQYVVRSSSGDVFGPASIETLRQWVREGRILADMAIAEAGTQNWRPAREFPGLADLFAPGQPVAAPTTGPVATVGQTVTPVSYQSSPAPGTDPMAIGSLVCSGLGLLITIAGSCCGLFWCVALPLGVIGIVLGVVGVVLGFVAKRRIAANPALGGAQLALLGIILGFVVIALAIIAILISLLWFGMSFTAPRTSFPTT